MTSPACATLLACERTCATNDSDCLAECELAYPSGVALQRALGQCLDDQCPMTCIAARWACLANPAPPPVPHMVQVTYHLLAFGTLKGAAGLTVKACGQTDLDCKTGIASATSTADGTAVLDVGGGLSHVEITGRLGTDDVGPVRVYLPPLDHDFVVSLPVLTHGDVSRIKSITSAAGLGTILGQANDCADVPAEGVEFSLSPSGQAAPFSVNEDLAAVTGPAVTGNTGFAGFKNVDPSQPVTLNATVVANKLSLAPINVQVTADTGAYAVAIMYASPP
jgi:hypothetical protein